MTEQLTPVIRYEVELVGHAAPYEWTCFRIGLDGIEYKVDSGEVDGELKDAVDAAEEAARIDEWERRHRNTKVRALLFESEAERSELARKERDAKVINYGLAGRGRQRAAR